MIRAKWLDNVSALQVFQLMRFSVLILIGILLVQSGYQKEEIGVYELFFFLANIVSFFWSMGLKNALISFFPSLGSKDQDKLLFNFFILQIGFGLLAGLMLFLFEDYMARILNGGNALLNLPKIVLYLILMAPAGIVEYFYILKEKSKSILAYGIIIFSIQLLGMAVLVFYKVELDLLLWFMAGWMGFRALWACLLILKNGQFHLDFHMQRTFLIFAMPLILHMLLGNGMEYVDGLLVNYFYDEGAFAQFRYGARELPITTILIGALSTAMIPLAVKDMTDSLQSIKTRIKRLSNVLFPVSIVLMLASPFVFPIIYSEEYLISAFLFNIYLLIISSRIWMPQVVLFAKHDNGLLLLSALIELLINVILSVILLKVWGMPGIAVATVIAFMVNKLMIAFFAWNRHSIRVSDYLNLKHYGTWVALLCLSFYISTVIIFGN